MADEALIHLRVPATTKARWVRESRAAGVRLTDWIIEHVEKSMDKITYNGRQYDFDAVANLMDDALREQLSSAQNWASNQAFFDAYLAAHSKKFGEEFSCD